MYGAKNFHQRLSGTPAMAQMVMLVVGQKRLEKPSPNWKARTAIWRLISSRSASGTISGMTMTARPELEEMRKFIIVWKKNIAQTVTIFGIPSMCVAKKLHIVSIIWPSWRTMRIPRASPMAKAAKSISLEMLTKASQVCPTDILLTKPTTSIMTMNIAESSEKYQPRVIAPHAKKRTVKAQMPREILWRVVNSSLRRSSCEVSEMKGNFTP